MSNSKQKSPFHSIARHRHSAQKKYRSKENRAKRRQVKIRLKEHKEMPHEKEYGNEWDSPREGKMYFGDVCSLKKYKKFMRK